MNKYGLSYGSDDSFVQEKFDLIKVELFLGERRRVDGIRVKVEIVGKLLQISMRFFFSWRHTQER